MLFFHPIVLPFLLIPAWIKSLWNSRVLLYEPLGNFNGFYARRSINNFFYKTQWINFEYYGRSGTSPSIGLGKYPLSKWFHLTQISSCLYAKAGASVMLAGTIFWIGSHFVWAGIAPLKYVTLIMFILFFSSTSYWMAFIIQNYNILGWMWLPIGFYAISTQQYTMASIIWLITSFLGFTTVFLVVISGMVLSFLWGSWLPLIVTMPAVIKTAFHGIPFLKTGNLRTSLRNTAKLIGLTQRGVRYKRKSMKKVDLFLLYTLLNYTLSSLLFSLLSGETPYLCLLAILLFILNKFFLRFADEQSIMIFFLTALTLYEIRSQETWGIPLLLSANMFPLFLFGFSKSTKWKEGGFSCFLPKIFRPFNHSSFLNPIESFFCDVGEGAKVLFAFENPDNHYEKIFDGYREILEAFLFVASKNKFHLFPDWYSVAETNYEGANSFWGRSPEEISTNMETWNAQYAVIYSDSEDSGFPKDFLELFSLVKILEGDFSTTGTKGAFLDELRTPLRFFLIKKQ